MGLRRSPGAARGHPLGGFDWNCYTSTGQLIEPSRGARPFGGLSIPAATSAYQVPTSASIRDIIPPEVGVANPGGGAAVPETFWARLTKVEDK